MKTFIVVFAHHREEDTCFLAQGESVDDPVMRQQIVRDIIGCGDGSYGDNLVDMDEEEVEGTSRAFKLYEVVNEQSCGDLLKMAWKQVLKEHEDWQKNREAEKERRDRKEFERLSNKFGKEK